MLYLIRLDVREPDDMSRSEFREAWRRGVAATRGSHGSGIVRSFKAVGRWTIYVVAEFPDNRALDEALMGLPIVEELGSAVEIEVIPVWPYDELGALGEAPVEPAEESRGSEEADRTEAADRPGGPQQHALVEPEEQEATVGEPTDQDEFREDTPVAVEPEVPLGPRVSLQDVSRPDDGEAFEVDRAGIGLGRGPSNHFVVDGPGVSYRHALIRGEGEVYRIEDLGSRNGTWVNDERVSGRYTIEDGDVIRIGGARLVFRTTDEAARHELFPVRSKISLTGMVRTFDALEEELAEPEAGPEAGLEETGPGEPRQPKEAGRATEATRNLQGQERTPAGLNEDEPEDPAADSPAQPEVDREREEAPVFVSVPRREGDPTATPARSSVVTDESQEEEASYDEGARSSEEDCYVRKELLGSGEVAEVYLAHDEKLDRDVVLKVLRKQYADDEEVVERFEREARNAAKLSHPNIVAIHDRGRARDGSYYMAMEYMPGGTLGERIRQGGPLSAPAAAGIALRVANSLSYAHELGVIHRDVKPQNVLLDGAGEAKITDFGLARAAAVSTITQEGVVLGTPHYVSPEQALGQPTSPQSDLYSLGVVLYEMLTGELPHDAKTPVEIVMKHVSGHSRPPKEIDPEIPEELDAVVVRLLARNPSDRYRDAPELIKDLEQVLGSLPDGSGEAGLEPTQVDEEGSFVGLVRGLDDADSEPPAEDQADGAVRSPDKPSEETAGTRVLLRAVAGPASSETFEVGQEGATIGRSPDNSIQINDERLSRRHASVDFEDGGFWLTDLGSSNGTFVNRNRLSAPHRLRSGDAIELGGIRLNVALKA